MALQDDIRTLVSQNLGIGGLPPEQQEHIIANLGQVVLERVMLEILKRIPEDKRDEFDRLADAGDQTGMETFLKQTVPGIDGIVKTAVMSEIDEFKKFMAGLQEETSGASA